MKGFTEILREQILKEGLTDIVYHFSAVGNAVGVFKDNAINASPVFGEEEELSKGKYYFISTTSTKDPKSGFASTMKNNYIPLVCFNLNGREINNRYKSVRVDYFSSLEDEEDGNVNKETVKDEMEDRIIMNEPSLSPLSKYVIEVHVEYSEDIEGDTYLYLKKKADELDVPIYFYDEEKNFASQNKQKSIDINELLSGEPDERQVFPTLQRKPVVGTKMLLALAIYEDDRMRGVAEHNIKAIEGIDEILERLKIDGIEGLFKESIDELTTQIERFDSEEYLLAALKEEVNKEFKRTKQLYKDVVNRTILHIFVKAMKKHKAEGVVDFLKKKFEIEGEPHEV